MAPDAIAASRLIGADPEAYLVLLTFLDAFCLLCFWLFLGLLSPIIALLSQASHSSIRFPRPAQGNYSMKLQIVHGSNTSLAPAAALIDSLS